VLQAGAIANGGKKNNSTRLESTASTSQGSDGRAGAFVQKAPFTPRVGRGPPRRTGSSGFEKHFFAAPFTGVVVREARLLRQSWGEGFGERLMGLVKKFNNPIGYNLAGR